MTKISIKNSVIVNTSADRVWQIMAKEFIDISHWARDVNDSYENLSVTTKYEGAPTGARFCEVSGMGKLEEHILHFDADKREITWNANSDKIPSFVKGLQNAWTIKQIDETTTQITTILTATLTGFLGTIMSPLMKLNFSKLMKGILEDLITYAETGNVSPTKKKQIKKLSQATTAASL